MTIFNLVRTVQAHPEILDRVLDRVKEEDREGTIAALRLIRRAAALLFAEFNIRGDIVAETDAVIARWGLDD